MDTLTITGSANDLTAQDVDILTEALDSWLKRRAAGEMLGSVFSAMLLKTEDQKTEYEKKAAEQRAQEQFQINEEKDNAAILKAKLIMIKRVALKDR